MDNYFTDDVTRLGNILPNSTQMVALHMIPIQRVNRVACCTLGLPPNILVVIVVARSRQLWSSPRNIYWLGVTFINFLMILQSLGELVTNILYQRKDESYLFLCKIHSTLLGCPFGLLLTSLTLASFDRYLALSRPKFYQIRVTIKCATAVLLGAFLIVAGFHTGPYWTGYYTPECGIRYKWLVITLFYQSFLSFTLVVIQIRLFMFIRNSTHNHLRAEIVQMEPISGHQVAVINPDEENGESSDHRMNVLELRSARILNLGILPFSLLTLTTMISSFLSVILRTQSIDDSLARTGMLTSRELLLISLVYMPFVFIVQSREFRLAVKRFYRIKVSQSVDLFA